MSYIIFVIIEVYIFIQIFGLYSGHETVLWEMYYPNLHRKPPAVIPAPSRSTLIFEADISWHLLNGPGIQCVSSV